jgi:hypothetical protein
MGKILKGIFSIKENNTNQNLNPEIPVINDLTIVDRYEEGRDKARKNNGDNTSLLVNIRCIYENHKELIRRDEIEQENAKKPYRVKLQEHIKKVEHYQLKIKKIKEEDIPKTKSKIENLQSDIRDIKNNPELFLGGDKASRMGFIIGTIIITFLTLYLFIFYSSASYSAFFKEFSLNAIGVANSIFDPQALSKAFHDGITELILILTIPFVFLGLGYLIHKFQEEKSWKKYPKVILLIIVTFIFDAILAYEITEKIYNIKAENSFADEPAYNVAMAFSSVNFWLIIFAGFLVYIIWGFVFDFLMEAYEKLDKIGQLIKSKYEQIKDKDDEIVKYEDEINKLNYLVSECDTEAQKLKTILEHSDIIKPKELEHSIMRFLSGWLEYLTYSNKPESEKENAHNIVSEFISVNVKPIELLTKSK